MANQATIFADEGNLKEVLKIYKPLIQKKIIRQALIISASGEKDAIWEINEAKKYKLKTQLLTCNKQASAAKIADKTRVFKKITEPYSYNFSTYLSMILAKYQENPKKIKNFLNKLNVPKKFNNFQYFTFILPDKYRAITDMIKVKDDEMFAANSSLRAFSEGQARHAKFIYQAKKELVISFGSNKYFGYPENRWEIKLPKYENYAFHLSLGYYLVGLIQTKKPDYFKNSLEDYCLNRGPKPYQGKNNFKILVPGDENHNKEK
ncbi:hypothetical protein EOM09_08535 [bacterium]|nr:hypothetical protein [bacterium]